MSTSSAPAGEDRPGSSPDGSPGADTAEFPVEQHPYLVVADRLEARIRRGEFGESGRLPSTRALMEHYKASMSVVDHARAELKQRGLVFSDGWRGTFTT